MDMLRVIRGIECGLQKKRKFLISKDVVFNEDQLFKSRNQSKEVQDVSDTEESYF